MNDLRVIAVRTDLVDEMRRTLLSPGYGHPVTSKVATGHGPCRHCLQPFAVGEDVRMLFTLDSFEGMNAIPQPGPVFVHQRSCERFAEDAGYPSRLREFGAVLDGYDATQRVTRRALVLDGTQENTLRDMLIDPAIKYILVRDASAGCYDFRVERRARMSGERVEPWLRGTLMEVDPLRRGVLHALELAAEDVAKWCSGLSGEELEVRPFGLAPVGFHLRHIARSLDRLLTYAEGSALTEVQLAKLRSEMFSSGHEATLMEFAEGIELAVLRVRRFALESYGESRGVGREGLPTTVVGLLVHCAEHTQRHAGQIVTTAKVTAGIHNATSPHPTDLWKPKS